MRKFAVLAVAAAFAFAAPSKAHAQIVVTTGTSYHGGYSGGYAPFGYGGTGLYGNNFGVVQTGYGIPNYGFVPSYPAGGYSTFSYPVGGYRTYSYPAYNQGYGNYGSYNRGFNSGGYGNRGYGRGGFGWRR
jgi:hypothetical protein